MELKRRADKGPIDVGPLSLTDFPEGASAPKLDAPLLLKTHMDAWVQTRPEPLVQPSLDWFLHGIDLDQRANPDISLVWRFDRSSEVLRLVPPRQVEFLQVPIDAAKSWLAGGEELDVADVTHAVAEREASLPTDKLSASAWVRWEGFGKEPSKGLEVNDIRAGDVLILDPRLGGLTAGSWDPTSQEPVTDLGDAAQLAFGRRATLRLDAHILGIPHLPNPADEIEADSSARGRISDWLSQRNRPSEDLPKWFPRAVERLDPGFLITAVGLSGDTPQQAYFVLTEQDYQTKRPAIDASTLDGSDEAGSLIGTRITLRRHLEGVGNRAGRIAERLGLDEMLVEDLRLAGRLHDVGKVDRRFQSQLVGGDPIDLEMLDEPLAKSLVNVPKVRHYPTGMRHEIASLAMVESNPDMLEAAHDRDLVCHLIGTHHGWARPLPPIIRDPEQLELKYQFDGYTLVTGSDLVESSLSIEMADRFWTLVDRFGYHGLAWLEAILRLADHQESAEEARR